MALRRSGLFSAVERDYVAEVAEIPNDPYFSSQWGLPKIAAPLSWELSSGSPAAPVALLDTGVDASHPDLAGQLLPGYDFVNGDADPSDDNGHGTRMAGIIAALRDNGEGISGVAPGTRILPVKVLGSDGTGLYSAVASGITYAVDHGARIVNLSLVGSAPSDLLQSAIDYATAHGVVTVAASGNSGSSDPTYPAASNGVVAVGATNWQDERPAFSNYGDWVALSAPGEDVVTTSLGGTYASSTGTSPAAAFTSGAFALLLAADPGLTRQEAINRMLAGAADLGSTGWDPYFGWGRVDSYAALVPGQVGSPGPDSKRPEVGITSPTKGSLVYGMVPVDLSVSDDQGIGRVELFVDNRLYATATSAPFGFVVDATTFAPGKHKLRAYAYDLSGNSARSKQVNVSFTPGVGLLVTRAKTRSNSASISALFALPEGTYFDSSRDTVSVQLSGAGGVVLFASAEPAQMQARSASAAKASVDPSIPGSGNVRLSLSQNGGKPVYNLRISAAQLTGMEPSSLQMDLTLQVGTSVLSQSLLFRAKKSDLFVYP
jgi:Subtilase family/Bacterial Ig domain